MNLFKQESIATVYANAVFRLAQGANSTDIWRQCINCLATAMHNTGLLAYIHAPHAGASMYELQECLYQIVTQQCALIQQNDQHQEHQANQQQIDVALGLLRRFIDLLTSSSRLLLLPAIATIFNQMVDEANNIVRPIVQSAFTLTDIQQTELNQLLASKLAKQVESTYVINEELIGGVRIIIGDVIFDASIKEALNKMVICLGVDKE